MMRQIEEMEEGQAKETMKKSFKETFLQKRKEKEDQWSRASSRLRKSDFSGKIKLESIWNNSPFLWNKNYAIARDRPKKVVTLHDLAREQNNLKKKIKEL